MRYRLRTLLIVLALGPPVLAGTWKGYRAYQEAREIAALHEAIAKFKTSLGDHCGPFMGPTLPYVDPLAP